MCAIDAKICGLTNRDDARAALEMGAAYLGFVLYAKSPRGITGGVLATIRDALPAAARCVGVFVNMPREEVERIAADCGLCAVQVHGDETAEAFEGMGVPLWRAVRARDGKCSPPPQAWPAQRYVVDAAPTGQYGGSGEVADWDLAGTLAARWPVMLAGGLTPDNVGAAICRVRPVGVDVSSGVEARPGKKDTARVKAFLTAVRRADAGEME